MLHFLDNDNIRCTRECRFYYHIWFWCIHGGRDTKKTINLLMKAVSKITIQDLANFVRLGEKAQQLSAWSSLEMTTLFHVLSVIEEKHIKESFDKTERATAVAKIAEYYLEYRKNPDLLSNIIHDNA